MELKFSIKIHSYVHWQRWMQFLNFHKINEFHAFFMQGDFNFNFIVDFIHVNFNKADEFQFSLILECSEYQSGTCISYKAFHGHEKSWRWRNSRKMNSISDKLLWPCLPYLHIWPISYGPYDMGNMRHFAYWNFKGSQRCPDKLLELNLEKLCSDHQ